MKDEILNCCCGNGRNCPTHGLPEAKQIKLADCPFCGHQPKLRQFGGRHYDLDFCSETYPWYIECGNVNCSCTFPFYSHSYAVAEDWNKRS